jgi:hypothetical protein
VVKLPNPPGFVKRPRLSPQGKVIYF